MKKSAIALGLAFGLAASASFAGGIQLQPDGSGNIAGSTYVDTPLGNSAGNLLLQNGFTGPAGAGGEVGTTNSTGLSGGGAFIYGHNSFNISGFGVPGELTFLMTMPVTVTAGTGGFSLNLADCTGGTFDLYYDPTADASAAGGTGYGASGGGILVASGALSIAPSTSLGFTNTSGTGHAAMADNNGTPSIAGNGSGVFNVDFTFKDDDYIVNELDALVIDLTSSNSLGLRYAAGLSASAVFADGAVSPDLQGANDFGCIMALTYCDLQVAMNTTISFTAPRVPEPATLALLGGGLALLGGAVRRRRKA